MEEKIINDMPRGAITNRLKITSGKWKKIKVSKEQERENWRFCYRSYVLPFDCLLVLLFTTVSYHLTASVRIFY